MIISIPQLFKYKAIRFLICGVITAVFNVVLLAGIIEFFNITTPLGRNMANLVALEIAVIFSFWVYKLGVWTSLSWNWQKIIVKQIPLYHASISLIIALRIFLIFPLLDWLGVQYMLNTVIGIVLGSVINYFSNDKIVFKE